MLKRIAAVAAVFAVLLAGGTARALVLCDSEGIEYNLRLANGEFVYGTAFNLPCGGTGTAVGSYTKVPEGWFFSLYVDQDPAQPQCCEGYEFIGIWDNGVGIGNWYDSREESPNCTDTGTFILGRCNDLPLRSEPVPHLPGLRF